MENIELIRYMQETLPETVAVIGYGSGIYKQENYGPEKPDKDAIVVVTNFRKFLIKDYQQNPHHFAKDFDKHVLYKQKSNSYYKNIGCLKYSEDGQRIKLMVISENALYQDLDTWRYFGMACRLTKPILYQDVPTRLDNAIKLNRERIARLALLYNPKDVLTPTELYETISQMSYQYDFRTTLHAEKKTKSKDIVGGAKDFFDDVYLRIPNLNYENGQIINEHILPEIGQMPAAFEEFMSKKNLTTTEEISKAVDDFLKKTNRINSIRLAISSGTTLGIKSSVKHGMQKVKKGLMR